ncbi:unnamed protein product [Calicophoron daubneyi]|uniref:Uncharacterized protein n=1 Tax=Calicophoron daubneyi TaxID=300641 RepID=A0AAV2T6A1_CALDB
MISSFWNFRVFLQPSLVMKLIYLLLFCVALYEIFLIHATQPDVHIYYHYDPKLHKDSSVDLTMVLKGVKVARRVTVLVKNILYFQGRLDNGSENCHLQIISKRLCVDGGNRQDQVPLRLHLIADLDARNEIETIFKNWHPSGISWYMYEMEKNWPKISLAPYTHPSGKSALFKLVIPRILPVNVFRTIVLDTDVLLNADVAELWDYFELFNDDQAIGCVWEQIYPVSSCELMRGSRIPANGMNSGVLLMDLFKLRKMDWETIRSIAARRFLLRHQYIWLADQGILNMVNSSLFYSLPCEWNVQLCYSPEPLCCPVIWPVGRPNESECLSTTTTSHKSGSRGTPNLVKLVHLNTRPKPEDVPRAELQGNMKTDVGKSQTTDQLVRTFHAVYHTFEDIPLKCFK